MGKAREKAAVDAEAQSMEAEFWPSLELRVTASAERLVLVREQVQQFIVAELGERASGFPMGEVMLAVQEAIANVARHAYVQAASPGPLGVQVQVEDGLVRWVVRDSGPGYDPTQVAPPPHDEPTPGGYGLFLIRCIMSRVEYKHCAGNNELVMEKYFEPVGA